MKTIIVRYAEIALKSEPVRRWFENLLVANIRVALGEVKHEIRRERGRIFVDTEKPKIVCKLLSGLPGIVSVSPSTRVPADLDVISREAVKVAKRLVHAGDTFAIRTSRDGGQPFTSKEVNERVGRDVLSAVKGARVNLSSPTREIHVELRKGDAYIFSDAVTGAGGLPVGSAGKVLVVFSGTKKDSEAAFLMLKRGCSVKFLFIGAKKSEKAVLVARKLLKHHPRLDFLSVPFDHKALLRNVRGQLKFYIHRRTVMRIAESAAKATGAEAIVLGDDVKLLGGMGLAGVSVTDQVCVMLVLRPLLGVEMEKIALSGEKLKTSKTHRAPPSESELRAVEKKLISEEDIQRAVKGMKTIRLRVTR
jgi:thiamine biosynthesis protein ThiI